MRKTRVAATQIQLPITVPRATGPEIMRSRFGPARDGAVCGTCRNFYQRYGTGNATFHACAHHDGPEIFRQSDRGCSLHQLNPDYQERTDENPAP